jgi:hypothetical protein
LRCQQGWSLDAALAEYGEFAEPTPRESDRAVISAWFQQPPVGCSAALACAA